MVDEARTRRRDVAVLVGGLLLLVLLVFDDFGITWDETVELFQRHKGPRTLAFWTGGFSAADAPFDTGHNPFVWLVYYSAFSALRILGVAPAQIDAYHLFTALTAVVGVVFAYRVAGHLMPHRWALAAALLVALSPRLLGHAFGNFKDIPFAVAWLASLDTLLTAVRAPSRRAVLWHGVAIGALIIQRIGGLLFAPISLLGLILVFRRPGAPGLGTLVLWSLAAGGLALGMHYLSYPYLLLHPIGGMVELFATQSDFAWHGVTLTLGDAIGIDRVPRWYASVWLLVTLPEIVLCGLVVGAVQFGIGRRRPDAAASLVLFSALFPLAWITAGPAPIYDGARHVLFVMPPLTVAAVAAWRAAHARLAATSPGRRVVPAILVLSALYLGTADVRLHPYQTVWFNQLVGGLPGAAGDWTLEYWSSTSRESARWLEDHGTAPRSLCVVGALENAWRVYLDPPWEIGDEDEASVCDPDTHYIFAYSRNRILEETAAFAAERPDRWEKAFTIERLGVPLAVIWKNTRPRSGAYPRRL